MKWCTQCSHFTWSPGAQQWQGTHCKHLGLYIRWFLTWFCPKNVLWQCGQNLVWYFSPFQYLISMLMTQWFWNVGRNMRMTINSSSMCTIQCWNGWRKNVFNKQARRLHSLGPYGHGAGVSLTTDRCWEDEEDGNGAGGLEADFKGFGRPAFLWVYWEPARRLLCWTTPLKHHSYIWMDKEHRNNKGTMWLQQYTFSLFHKLLCSLSLCVYATYCSLSVYIQ